MSRQQQIAFDGLQELFPTSRFRDPVRAVVDRRGAGFGIQNACAFRSHGRSSASAARATVTRTPAGGALLIWMTPPWRSMIRLAIESPRPVPTPTGLVVKKGSKTLGRSVSLTPVPVSRTSATTSLEAGLK